MDLDTIGAILLFVAMAVAVWFGLNNIEDTPIPTTTVEKSVEECEHEWVITSEYDYWTNSYRTISKCANCGEKVK